MKLFTILALVAGLALFGWLLLHYGAAELFAGVAAAGWGVLWVSLYRFVTIWAHGMGWRALFPPDAAPRFWIWFRARWAGEAINSLLPVAQVGGDVARAAMVVRHTTSGAVAGATVLVDFTAGLVAQFLYTMLGVALLATAAAAGMMRGFAVGLLVAAAVLTAFWFAQKSNALGRFAEKFAARGSRWATLAGGITELHRATAALYSDRPRLMQCVVWRLCGWLLLTGETWLALHFLGHTPTLANALVLESLSMAVRSAAFALPGALGVQEAGFVLLGPMVGISAETALALALVKRLREVLVGVSGLWVWGASERSSLARLLRGAS